MLAGIHHASYDLLAIKTAQDFARSFENITLPVKHVFILFIEKYIFCHLALLPTLILAGKVMSLLIEPRPVRDSTGLPANIRLGWKWLSLTNTLAYFYT